MIPKQRLWLLVVPAVIVACQHDPGRPAGASSGGPPASASAAVSPTGPARALTAPVREGGALVRTAAGDALLVADEDHKVVRRVSLPLPGTRPPRRAAPDSDGGAAKPAESDGGSAPNPAGDDAGSATGPPENDGGVEPGATARTIVFTVPGAPAQVLALGDGRVLVTIRDPGLLLVLRPDAAAGLAEEARVALPADAWGVAITPDEKTALVTYTSPTIRSARRRASAGASS
jgi:hypothetical protein